MSQLNPKKLKDKISYLQGIKDKLQQSRLKIELAKELDRADVALEYSKGNYTYFDNLKSFTKKELQFIKSVRLEQFEKAISNLQEQLKQFQKPKKLTELTVKNKSYLFYEHNLEIVYAIFKKDEGFHVDDYINVQNHFNVETLNEAKQKVYELFNNYLDSLESKSKNTNSHNFKKGDIVFYPCSIDNKTKNLRCKVIDTTKESVHIESVEDSYLFKNWICHIQIINEKDVM